MLLRSPSVINLFHFSLQYAYWKFEQCDWFGILDYLLISQRSHENWRCDDCRVGITHWPLAPDKTIVIAFWKCQSCLLPLPPPSPLPPQKKWIAILFNFSQVMQWLQETLKTVLRQFGGGGGGGRIEGRHKQGLWQEIQKWWIVLFPSFIFFALFSWPYKLNGQVQN